MKTIKQLVSFISLLSAATFASQASEITLSKVEIQKELQASLQADIVDFPKLSLETQFRQMLDNETLKSQASVYLTSITKTIKEDTVQGEE